MKKSDIYYEICRERKRKEMAKQARRRAKHNKRSFKNALMRETLS